MDTTIYITAWNDIEYRDSVNHLRKIGVKNPIIRINEKTSRPISMNKAMKSCKTKFICYMDVDIRMCKTPFIKMAEETLDADSSIGMIVIPGDGVDDWSE